MKIQDSHTNNKQAIRQVSTNDYQTLKYKPTRKKPITNFPHNTQPSFGKSTCQMSHNIMLVVLLFVTTTYGNSLVGSFNTALLKQDLFTVVGVEMGDLIFSNNGKSEFTFFVLSVLIGDCVGVVLIGGGS